MRGQTMSKNLREFLGVMFYMVMIAGAMVLAIFLFQSYFHPYEKNCRQEAIGRVCDVAYNLYWKPTFKI